MTCRRTCGVAAVALLLLGGATSGAAWAADQPPRNLHQVGDHWTAWDPPTEAPAGAQVYTIVAGDTLWGLAAKFNNNPYLWPQLWEKNQYIKDAHWIYPGDPLVVSMEVAPVEDLAEQDLGGEAGGDGTAAEDNPNMRLDRTVAPPEPLGSENDIYCSGYIGDPAEEFAYRVIGSEYDAQSPGLFGTAADRSLASGLYGEATVKYNLSVGDIVYLDGGMAAGLAPGLVYTVVQPSRDIPNPLDGGSAGRLYRYTGRVRVLTVNETVAIAEIVQSCDAIQVGATLKPFVPEPVPLGRRTGLRPANVPVAQAELEDDGIILYSKDEVLSIGQDTVVYISMGADKGVSPGDIYTVYRSNRPGLPPVVLGELAVLSVHEHTAVARVLESRYTIFVGDRLEPK